MSCINLDQVNLGVSISAGYENPIKIDINIQVSFGPLI